MPAGPDAPRSRVAGVVRFLAAHQLNTVVTLVTGLVATPVLLAWLGPERFGLYRVVEAWGTYLTIGGQALGQAVGVGLVGVLAAGDRTAVGRYLASAIAATAGVAALTVAVGLALVPAMPWLAEAPAELAGELRWAFLIVVAGLIAAPAAVGRALFEADQLGYRVSLGLTMGALVTVGLNLLFAHAGYGLPGQAAAAVAGSAGVSLLLAAWAWRSYPDVPLGRPSRDEVRTLGRTAGAFVLAGAFGVIASRVEVLVANKVAGADGVTDYFLTQRLFALWQGQVAAVCVALWAPFADLFHRGEREVLHARVRTGVYVVVGLSVAGLVPFVGYDQHFLRLWRVGAERFAGPAVVAGFAVALPLAGVQALLGWLLVGTGFARQVIPCAAAYSAVAVAACGGLGWAFGLAGVAAGMVAANAVLVLAQLAVLRKHHRLPASAVLGPLVRGTLVAGPLAAAAGWVGSWHAPGGWATLLAEMGGWFAAATLAFLAALPGHERRQAAGLIGRVVRRGRG